MGPSEANHMMMPNVDMTVEDMISLSYPTTRCNTVILTKGYQIIHEGVAIYSPHQVVPVFFILLHPRPVNCPKKDYRLSIFMSRVHPRHHRLLTSFVNYGSDSSSDGKHVRCSRGRGYQASRENARNR